VTLLYKETCVHILNNEKLIKTRSTWSGRLMLAGFALIIVSAALTFLRPPSDQNLANILPAYAALFGGFIIFNIGAASGSKWRLPPRPDQALAKALKGLDNRYRLYNFLLPAEHVLLTPAGITVFQVRRMPGVIVCNGDRWIQRKSLLSRLRFLAEEQLGNPTKDVQQDVTLITEYATKNLEGLDIPIKGLVIFAHPTVQLTLNNPVVPVLKGDDLKAYIRQATAQGPLIHPDDFQDLADLFDKVPGGEEVEVAAESEAADPIKARRKNKKQQKEPK
jgi:hypothetical protein